MNNTVENDFFGFPKVKWLHLAGEVDKCVRCLCHIFSGFDMPKSVKSVNFLQSYKKNKKVDIFWNTVHVSRMNIMDWSSNTYLGHVFSWKFSIL